MDNESIVDILFHNAFVKIGFKDNNLKSIITLLHKFTGDFIMSCGMITLPLSRDFPKIATVMVDIFWWTIPLPSTRSSSDLA